MSTDEELALIQKALRGFEEHATEILLAAGEEWTAELSERITQMHENKKLAAESRVFALLAEIGYCHLLTKWGATVTPTRN